MSSPGEDLRFFLRHVVFCASLMGEVQGCSVGFALGTLVAGVKSNRYQTQRVGGVCQQHCYSNCVFFVAGAGGSILSVKNLHTLGVTHKS